MAVSSPQSNGSVPPQNVEAETSVPTILVTPENLADVEAQLGDTVFPVEAGAGTPTA